jgi:hypothetical protein
MRTLALAFAAAAAVLILPAAVSAQTFQVGPGGISVDDGRGRRTGGQCEQLRLACENKDRLGEGGEGNCRRYRQTCQAQARPSRQQVCQELRQACMNKDQLGEGGEGNCRRYRQTCRG